jgi:diaminohydroxyphosphoribosylaminopyrimidine deaminase / 5-amino-6-(5-phosphoribosylamino)uracil reductase
MTEPDLSAEDRAFLAQAVALGRRGWGQVHPNPMVGCVVVRDGAVLAEGWHTRFGAPHAEVEALEALRATGGTARGSTVYVSLEPCAHWGKTPPCTEALLSAGVERVVYGGADGGSVSGGGGDWLRARGVRVWGPVFSPEEARRLNPVFFHPLETRPWVALKLAISADGMIAAAPGVTTAISGPEALEAVHRLRSGFDALMVGGETARVDDPRLNVRHAPPPRIAPLRVVLDAEGHLLPSAQLFRTPGGETVVFRGPGGGAALPGRVETLEVNGEGNFATEAVLSRLRELGVRSVLCEGGASLASSLLHSDAVDRLILIRSERMLGPGGVSAGLDRFVPALGEAWALLAPPERMGDDRWSEWDRQPTQGGNECLRES